MHLNQSMAGFGCVYFEKRLKSACAHFTTMKNQFCERKRVSLFLVAIVHFHLTWLETFVFIPRFFWNNVTLNDSFISKIKSCYSYVGSITENESGNARNTLCMCEGESGNDKKIHQTFYKFIFSLVMYQVLSFEVGRTLFIIMGRAEKVPKKAATTTKTTK